MPNVPQLDRRAFVLISFEAQFESVYTDLIKAPLEALGFQVERADSRLDQRNILQDIFRGIAGADLVVADLTGLNPNVFYELGVAHALAIPTILVTQNVEELPFDLRAYRANEYSTHFTESQRLVETISDIGRGVIAGTISFSSPATDFLPEGIGRRPPVAPATAAAEEPDEETEDEETAWFDAMVRSEEASEAFVAAMDRLTAATEVVGTKVGAHAVDFENLALVDDAQRVKRTSNQAIRVANDLDQYAVALEAELPVIETSASFLLGGMTQYLAWLQANPSVARESGEQVHDLQQAAQGLLETVRENLPTTREFRETVLTLRGFSRAINSASTRVVKALDHLITHTETVEAETARILSASEALSIREQSGVGESSPN